MARTYGLTPSPHDSRDLRAENILFGASIAPPPEEWTALLAFASIHNQGGTSSCVAHAIAQALRIFLKARGLSEDLWPSVLFLYWNTLKAQGTIVDGGCQPRTALQTLTDLGFCSADAWPFVESKVLDQPLPDAYTGASDQRLISSYYRVASTGDDKILAIKQAIAKSYPVIYGGPVNQAYEDYDGTGTIPPPTGSFLGNHMRCIVGYTKDYAIEANSWDTNWGVNGFGHLSWDFVKDPQNFEFWVFDGVPVPTESP